MGSTGEALVEGAFRGYFWWTYCQKPRGLIPPGDIYLLHSFEYCRAVEPLARRLGAKIIYDAHDFYRGIEPSEYSSKRAPQRPFLNDVENRLVATADLCTTVSGGVADLMTETFGRRPEVIRNCHDSRFDRVDTPPLRETLGLSETDKLLVLVGNYKSGLAVEEAAAALLHLPENVHLAFVGRGYQGIAAGLPDGLASRVHFGCAFSPNEIVPAIRSADIGLVLYKPYSENYRSAPSERIFSSCRGGSSDRARAPDTN